MGQIVSDDLAAIGTVHVGYLDLVGLGVAPVNFPTFEVQSDAVRPDDVFGDEGDSFGAIKIAALDLRPLFVPIRPEHQAVLGCHRDCPRLE